MGAARRRRAGPPGADGILHPTVPPPLDASTPRLDRRGALDIVIDVLRGDGVDGGPSAAPVRVAAAVALAPTAGLTAHLIGGGALAPSCLLVLATLGVALASTAAAVAGARRGRGPWLTLVASVVGQLTIETLLSLPEEHLPSDIAATGFVHVATAVASTAVLLGGERVSSDLAEMMTRLLPRWSGSPITSSPARVPCALRDTVLRRALLRGQQPSSPRGPPVWAPVPA